MEPSSQFVVPSIRNIEGPLTEEQARTALEEQERSGLSVGEYARRYGLAASQLYKWRQRVDKKAAREAATRFVPVRLAPAPEAPPRPGGTIEVVCSGGKTVRVIGEVIPERLTAVLKAIGAASC